MEIKNVEVNGMHASIVRSGYPKRMDEPSLHVDLSEVDWNRAKRLGTSRGGEGHDNFLKGIRVAFDIKYPQYWTPQFQRYGFVDIVSSQSKMHTLTSCSGVGNCCNKWVHPDIAYFVDFLIELYNDEDTQFPFADEYIVYKDAICDTAGWIPNSKEHIHSWHIELASKQDLFQTIVANLPMGYEMWMGVNTNYLQLKTIYKQRRRHKLEEWQYFCNWIETLPHFMELCVGE